MRCPVPLNGEEKMAERLGLGTDSHLLKLAMVWRCEFALSEDDICTIMGGISAIHDIGLAEIRTEKLVEALMSPDFDKRAKYIAQEWEGHLSNTAPLLNLAILCEDHLRQKYGREWGDLARFMKLFVVVIDAIEHSFSAASNAS